MCRSRENFQMSTRYSIYLQTSAFIQPRTSPRKFGRSPRRPSAAALRGASTAAPPAARPRFCCRRPKFCEFFPDLRRNCGGEESEEEPALREDPAKLPDRWGHPAARQPFPSPSSQFRRKQDGLILDVTSKVITCNNKIQY